MTSELFVAEQVIKVPWHPFVHHIILPQPLPVSYFPERETQFQPQEPFKQCVHEMKIATIFRVGKHFAWAYCHKSNKFFWSHPTKGASDER